MREDRCGTAATMHPRGELRIEACEDEGYRWLTFSCDDTRFVIFIHGSQARLDSVKQAINDAMAQPNTVFSVTL